MFLRLSRCLAPCLALLACGEERGAQALPALAAQVAAQAAAQPAPVRIYRDELGLPHRTWFPNVNVRGGGRYGNAILSRYPIIESSNIDLTLRFKKKRSALHGVIRVRHDDIDRTFHVFNMHLGLARYEFTVQDSFFEPLPGAVVDGFHP